MEYSLAEAGEEENLHSIGKSIWRVAWLHFLFSTELMNGALIFIRVKGANTRKEEEVNIVFII